MTSKIQRFDEINITPLTDIFLVLLIIMMVVAPVMMQKNNEIQLPSIEHGKALSPHLLTVEVTAQGAYLLEGKTVAIEGLGQAIKSLLPTVTEAKVLLRADKASTNKAILAVMKAIANTGVERLVFEARSEAAPTKEGTLPRGENQTP
ncbi:MAG: protein TolR [Vampirovibrio sp.]